MTRSRFVRDIAVRVLANLRERLGDSWEELELPDRELIIACAADAAELQVRALGTPATADAQLALLREKAQIQAQLANLAAVGKVRISNAFWDAVKVVVNGGVAIAFAAL